MGLHTWFHKNKTTYDKLNKIYQELNKLEDELGESFFEDERVIKLQEESDKLYDENEAEYHDVFRTNKRNEDGTYSDDVIYSKEETYKWLKENSKEIDERQIERLDKFWEEYPNGVIDFG